MAWPAPLTPAKQISNPHTIGVVVNPILQDNADDDDNHICPVCDGECTCHVNSQSALVHRQSLPPPFSSITSAATTAAYPHVYATKPVKSKQKLPSLKIKLTVPQNLLGNKKGPTANSSSTIPAQYRDLSSSPTSSSASLPLTHHQYQKTSSIPKRRGRPPKSALAARQIAAPTSHHPHAQVTLPSMSHPSRAVTRHATPKPKPKTRSSVSRRTSTYKASSLKRIPPKRRRVYQDSDDETDASSELSQIGEDTESGPFPTFVSASALSSLEDSEPSGSTGSSSSSSSDSSDHSDFETDVSLEAEEEKYIVAEESRGHDKARIRRELLGEDAHRRRDTHQNDWVIRPRKRSVGLSDVDMDADSDATEEDAGQDEQGEEEDCGEDEDEETDDRSTSRAFVSLVTGWSEDEQSSFDADIFFANLSSESTDESSSGDEGGEDGDQSDLETMSSEAATSGFLPPRENLPFEVTEGWDGRVIFTNGLNDTQGMTDLDLEIDAAQLFVEAISSSSPDTDVEMATEVDEDGYEQDGDGGEGDTTDEELVGDDDLPNERAMRLFHFPYSVSAIDPMSTMSPAVSPSPRNRKPFDSPKPCDILAGRAFWDSEGFDEAADTATPNRRLSTRDGQPRSGVFEANNDVRQVIIDGVNKEIPSPHPRFPGRGRTITRPGRGDIHRRRQFSDMSIIPSPGFSLVSASDIGMTSPELPPAALIDLGEVLEASFLDSDPFDTQDVASSTTMTANNDGNENDTTGNFSEPRKPENNPSRWDHIPVSAFRNSRESNTGIDGTPTWRSEEPGPAPTNYESMMKPSPLSPMLWQNKSAGKRTKRKHIISPVILPLHDEDECTPTSTPTVTPLSTPIPPSKKQNQNHHGKTRRELRRERKLKRKSYGPTHHNQHFQHHYHHHHYPNSKSRSTASVQRNFSNSSSIPSLSI